MRYIKLQPKINLTSVCREIKVAYNDMKWSVYEVIFLIQLFMVISVVYESSRYICSLKWNIIGITMN